MLYLCNGTDLGTSHKFQIAYGNDGATWNYLTKTFINRIEGHNTFVRLIFDDESCFDIDLFQLANAPTGWEPTLDGVQTAIDAIALWIEAN